MVALATLLTLACLQDAHGMNSSSESFSPQSDEAFLTRYKPWVLEYRQNPLTVAYVLMADVFPIMPSFLNMYVRSIFPGGRIRVPVDGDWGTMQLHVDSITVTDLDHIKEGKVSMVKGTRYTWFLNLKWDKLTAIVEGSEKNGLGQECPVTMTVPMENVTAEVTAVVGLNKTRVCEQWMDLQEDARCALWSVIFDPWRIVSGLKVTQMRVYMDDFDAVPTAHCAEESTNKVMEDSLRTAMMAQKPTILFNLQHGNAGVITATNSALYDAVAAEHADPRCNIDGSDFVSVNKVCVSSSTSSDSLRWSFLDCPTCALSQHTQQSLLSDQCQSIGELFPDTVQGESLRIVIKNSSQQSLVASRFRYTATARDSELHCDEGGCVVTYVSGSGVHDDAWWLVVAAGCLLLGLAAVGGFVWRRRQRPVNEDLETSLQVVVN